MKRLKPISIIAATVIGFAVATNPVFAQETGSNKGPIRIGVPAPMTGALAAAGHQLVWGVEYAAEQANAKGGLLGRKIKLVVMDTKGETNTAASIAAKLATQANVDAIIGGFGSTASYAMLTVFQRYDPLFIHAGSSSVRLEKSFGENPWYFHVYIWDYLRQKAAVNFFKSIAPPVETIAIAYEDGLYGTSAADFTKKFAKQAGIKVVMKEPFRAGSPNFSSILTRVDALNPGALFFIGYSGDNLRIAQQVAELKLDLDLLVLQGAGATRSDFGKAGVGVAVVDLWSPKQTTPGLQGWVKLAEADHGGPVVSTGVQGYIAMKTLIRAVKAIGEWDKEAIIEKMETMTYDDTPYGVLTYDPSKYGGLHQLLTEKDMIAIQMKPNGEVEVVWPEKKATGELTYPAP